MVNALQVWDGVGGGGGGGGLCAGRLWVHRLLGPWVCAGCCQSGQRGPLGRLVNRMAGQWYRVVGVLPWTSSQPIEHRSGLACSIGVVAAALVALLRVQAAAAAAGVPTVATARSCVRAAAASALLHVPGPCWLQPLGNGHLYPRGTLLERPKAALRRADAVVLHHADLAGKGSGRSVETQQMGSTDTASGRKKWGYSVRRRACAPRRCRDGHPCCAWQLVRRQSNPAAMQAHARSEPGPPPCACRAGAHGRAAAAAVVAGAAAHAVHAGAQPSAAGHHRVQLWGQILHVAGLALVRLSRGGVVLEVPTLASLEHETCCSWLPARQVGLQALTPCLPLLNKQNHHHHQWHHPTLHCTHRPAPPRPADCHGAHLAALAHLQLQ